MTFHEHTLITTLKVMVFVNLFGFATIIWCLANIFAPKPPKVRHEWPEAGSIMKLNEKGDRVWVAPDGKETPVIP